MAAAPVLTLGVAVFGGRGTHEAKDGDAMSAIAGWIAGTTLGLGVQATEVPIGINIHSSEHCAYHYSEHIHSTT